MTSKKKRAPAIAAASEERKVYNKTLPETQCREYVLLDQNDLAAAFEDDIASVIALVFDQHLHIKKSMYYTLFCP